MKPATVVLILGILCLIDIGFMALVMAWATPAQRLFLLAALGFALLTNIGLAAFFMWRSRPRD